MICLRSLLALTSFLALTSASALPSDTAAEIFHFNLLARQEPGTPLYACHLACGTSSLLLCSYILNPSSLSPKSCSLNPHLRTGTAVTLSRGASPCTDVAFLIDYTDCLACADASIQNVWRYYGATLTIAGEKCGLSTTPVVAVSDK